MLLGMLDHGCKIISYLLHLVCRVYLLCCRVIIIFVTFIEQCPEVVVSVNGRV